MVLGVLAVEGGVNRMRPRHRYGHAQEGCVASRREHRITALLRQQAEGNEEGLRGGSVAPAQVDA